MSLPPGAPPGALELPSFSLDVEALDLGPGVKAVGLELVETENREPVRGKKAAEIWSAVFPALAHEEYYVVDFFSHIDRVEEFCKARKLSIAKQACAVWFCRSRVKVNCSNFSSASKAKPLDFARGPLRKLPTLSWKATFRNAASMPTNPLTNAMSSAPSASLKMAGLRCSALRSGPAK